MLARLMADLPELFSEGKLDVRFDKEIFGGVEVDRLLAAGRSVIVVVSWIFSKQSDLPFQVKAIPFLTGKGILAQGRLQLLRINLQVLKVLQRSYYGKVKMIYIDPPYNTGDFIYSDQFTRTRREELIANGSMDAEGNIINVTGRSGPPSCAELGLRGCVAKDVVNDVACGVAGCGRRFWLGPSGGAGGRSPRSFGSCARPSRLGRVYPMWPGAATFRAVRSTNGVPSCGMVC